ncbi:MAG: helix-turn-helix transcriptional regulator [Veillonella caviae]|nr:helix-turn-helix transcriptional regulator [Veillonella caviae]
MTLFSKRLKETMNARNMTQSELSTLTSIRASSISDWINDKYQPKQDKIAILAKALNVSPAWLMGYDELSPTESYYEDPEVAEYAEELRTNPEMKLLFSAARDISKESMKKTYEYIKFLKSQERGTDE